MTPRGSTWLTFTPLEPRPLPVRDDLLEMIGRVSRRERLLRLAWLRGDRAAWLIVSGSAKDKMARCGIRGCENPHPATEWVEDRDRD